MLARSCVAGRGERAAYLSGQLIQPALVDLLNDDLFEDPAQVLDRADLGVLVARPAGGKLRPPEANCSHLDLLAEVLELRRLGLVLEEGANSCVILGGL